MSRVKDIAKEIETIAPKFLKEDYDNVGLMVGDKNKEVKTVLLALDCTKDVIKEAIQYNSDLIITHHPLLFKKPKSIIKEDLVGEKVISLIKEDISLYSCHTNLDSAKDGINETIVKMLGFESNKIIEASEVNAYEDAGIGRIINLNESMLLDDIIEIAKEKLNIEHMRIVRGREKVNKMAVINGSGQDLFYRAKNLGADCIISGDTTYHFASDFKEMGISIIDAGHFSTEWLVFIKTLQFLKEKFPDVKFINSKTCKDPYEFI